MNLLLHLTPETEVKLLERASLAGKQPEEIALEVLRDQLNGESPLDATLAPEAWLREFDAWVSEHKSRNPSIDDSRESIYPDRT